MSTLHTFSTSMGKCARGTSPVQGLHVLYTCSNNFNKTCNSSVWAQSCYKYYRVNLEKDSQKILALLKPEKAAVTQLVQYYEGQWEKKPCFLILMNTRKKSGNGSDYTELWHCSISPKRIVLRGEELKKDPLQKCWLGCLETK